MVELAIRGGEMRLEEGEFVVERSSWFRSSVHSLPLSSVTGVTSGRQSFWIALVLAALCAIGGGVWFFVGPWEIAAIWLLAAVLLVIAWASTRRSVLRVATPTDEVTAPADVSQADALDAFAEKVRAACGEA